VLVLVLAPDGFGSPAGKEAGTEERGAGETGTEDAGTEDAGTEDTSEVP
jgi:hypothetical protein